MVYPSIRNELRTFMKDGQTTQRATFNLTKSSGGLDNIKNASSIPKVTELMKYPGNTTLTQRIL